jgi:DMSO/TMAO reductase YedYZ heme-binding membrane subunit
MTPTSNQRNWLAFGLAALLTAAGSATYFAMAGIDDASLVVALRTSAHMAFVVLLLVFVARPLRQLKPARSTTALLRNRRFLGLVFAGIHAVHLGLIVLRARLHPEFGLFVAGNLAGAVVYLAIVAMFVTSFDAPARALGRKRWRVLHKTGLYLVFAAFVPTLVPASRAEWLGANGVLCVLAAAGIAIRLAAYVRVGRREAGSGRAPA